MLNPYEAWFESNTNASLADFFAFLRFPSISTDLAYRKELFACKDWLASYMKKIGLEVEVWETGGAPVIFGSSVGQGGPTVLFYGHYDVQPPDPLDEWNSPPFEPEMREGAIYARGAVDNKGQAFYTLLAIRAFLEKKKDKRITIKCLIEGEEEIGSSGLEKILEKKREALQADHVFIVDIEMYGEKMPAVTLGTRGITNLNVIVQNSAFDLHSGAYGGIAVNPAHVLVKTLAMLWDEKGQVAVPGFYADISPLSKEEKELFDWEGDPEKEVALLGVKVCQSQEGFSCLESNWIRPSLDVNGIKSGYIAKGFKTIIPSKAMVKLSCRLVPNQDPDHILCLLEEFFKRSLPKEMDVSFERGNGAQAFITSPKSETARLAAQAYERVYQVRCRRKLCGATIPIAPSLSKICQGEVVMMGVALGVDQIHAPNESFGFDRFKEGFLSITQLLEILSNGEKDECEGANF